MKWNRGRSLALAATMATAMAAVLLLQPAAAQQQPPKPTPPPPQPMGFFITSAGSGNGANLGGLDGADKHCQTLAAAAGAGNRTMARVPEHPAGGRSAGRQRARPDRHRALVQRQGSADRGQCRGPAGGDIERDRNNIRKPTALNEKGGEVSGVGDKVNQHDMLTGSDSRGRVPLGAANTISCDNWTSNADTSRAMLGHHDRLGGGQRVVERRPPERRLQPGVPGQDRRRGPVLLLRGEITPD